MDFTLNPSLPGSEMQLTVTLLSDRFPRQERQHQKHQLSRQRQAALLQWVSAVTQCALSPAGLAASIPKQGIQAPLGSPQQASHTAPLSSPAQLPSPAATVIHTCALHRTPGPIPHLQGPRMLQPEHQSRALLSPQPQNILPQSHPSGIPPTGHDILAWAAKEGPLPTQQHLVSHYILRPRPPSGDSCVTTSLSLPVHPTQAARNTKRHFLTQDPPMTCQGLRKCSALQFTSFLHAPNVPALPTTCCCQTGL